MFRPSCRALLLAVTCAGLAPAAHATSAPTAFPVCTLAGDQLVLTAVPDGAGGAIVAWRDGRTPGQQSVFAEHVRADLSLDPAWPAGGVTPNAPATYVAAFGMETDGAGGALLVWREDPLVFGTPTLLHAQHLLADGTFDSRWPAQGRAIAPKLGDEVDPVTAPDGRGGMLVAWTEPSALGSIAFVQHVSSDGAFDPAWPAVGLALGSFPAAQFDLRLVSDDDGGAIVTWRRPVGEEDPAYRVQHVRSDGTIDPRWARAGQPLTSITGRFADGLALAPDGSHGLFAAWNSGPSFGGNLIAQHLGADGSFAPGWPDSGVAITPSELIVSGPLLARARSGGVYLAWAVGERGVAAEGRLQHIGPAGVDRAWPHAGLAIDQPIGLVADGADGVIVNAVAPSENWVPPIVAQHVRSSSRLDAEWNSHPPQLPAPANEGTPVALPDGAGGEFVAWSSLAASGQDMDAVATAIRADGRVARAPQTLAHQLVELGLGLDVVSGNPAPHAAQTTLRFRLPVDARARLGVFDVTGRRVATLRDETLPAGEASVTWDGQDVRGEAVRAGVYFYRLEAGGRVVTVRGVRF